MTQHTSRLALPYPNTDNSESPAGPDEIHALALALDGAALDGQGVLADRPVSSGPSHGIQGRYYWVIGDSTPANNGILWRDNGAGWDAVGTVSPNSVGTTELKTDAVTQAKIGDAAVGTAELIDANVTSVKLAAGAVTGAKIADALKPSAGASGATEALRALGIAAGTAAAGNDGRLSDNRAPTDGSVTTAKLVDDSVTAAKIAADAVGSSEIAANAVGSSELADNAVDTAAIQDGAVTSAKIAANAVGSSAIAADAVGTSEIAADAVTSSEIAADAVGTSEIAADAVTSAEIAAGAVGASEIADGSVTLGKLNAASLSAINPSYPCTNPSPGLIMFAGSAVLTTDANGEAELDYGATFPTAVITVVVSNGDVNVGNFFVGSFSQDVDKCDIRVIKINPNINLNGLPYEGDVRVSWIAIGY